MRKINPLFFMRSTPRWMRPLLALGLFFPSAWIGVTLGDTLFLIFFFGLDAFRDGLQFVDSKHGVLTDGTQLPPSIDFLRALFGVLLALVLLVLVLRIADSLIGKLGQGQN